MSFGFAVGDFIAAGTLAWNVYRSCKGMRKEFAELGREARAAHTVVKELVEEAKDEQSVLNRRGAARTQELLSLVSGLQKVLEEFDRIIVKYRGLSRREQRIWDQLRLASEDLGGIRDKLSYHLAAITAFTNSLERGTLARMETVMLELVEEVRQGRRPPTLVSIDHLQDTSGWKELESELAEDGITAADVVEHKAAIRIFLLGRLKDSNADDLSFHDLASAVETGSGSGFIANTTSSPSETSDRPLVDVERKDTIGTQQSFHTAREQLEPEPAPALPEKPLQVSFAPFTRVPQQAPSDAFIPAGSVRHFGQLTFGKSTMRNYRYRRSVDYGRDRSLLGPQTQMILIIDPIHSSFSKIMHAYLRSLTINRPLIRERIDTVCSTGWKMQESGGIDMIQIDDMIKELLLTKGVEVPAADSYNRIPEFHLGDILQFDHIIYLESPSFLQFQYLEANVQRIARIKADEDMEEKQPARLSKYDLPNSIQLPEVMSEKRGLGTQFFRSRQKLALEEIFKTVQRFANDFLEREFGIRKSSQGFKKVMPRRPSSASLTSTVGLREPSVYD
ncbi:MAG: hypothetical protein L6R38_009433 [Xanthoria sp. 2 TBL-2021]|nr:MAG: hypothetical protein L6R38_009433 [Xanthoria sp. 2 TBL-2021]